ncbi:MFS transporter [Oceanobacillus sp. Castelsardo]|uniref:MFS transporter n=1 Tax=Oceanobacillus sp. Castelsardo TaxID=1851204 RepID=UPI000A406E4F|nr:MFS transporter [Oceanobacillus sp. Castelsardo]
MSAKVMEGNPKYNSAKMWQIAFFALNNTATNLYMFAIGFVSYYATGVAGLSVVVVSTILTAMRIFDGFTDPIIGFIIDKTESKFGKFRPMMVIGNVILASTMLIMYNVTHLLPESMQFLFFIAIYAVYIIGYTFQTAVTKAAQTVLTNNPKQRPLFSVFDASYNIFVFTGGQVFVASYLVGKHGDFTLSLFKELNMYAIILSGIFTILAIIAIWEKDRKEFFGLADQTVETRFRDYWPVLKGNRPMQMLVIAASTDKLASSIVRQPAVLIMFFGIMLGDYALSGTISMITIIPSLLITFLGVGYARKVGLKNSFVKATWIALISFAILVVFLLIIEPTVISLSNIGIATIIFLVLYSLGMGLTGLTNALVIPMIADVSDYETYNTGRYVPGMMGTIFSFVDKLISSLAPAVVGFLVAFIGYTDEFPQLGESLTVSLLVMTLILKFGIPMLGWIASIIAMKFYALDNKKMEEIQTAIADIKENAKDNEIKTS